MDRVLFQLGPFTVFTFGATIAAGTLAAFWLADKEAEPAGLDADKISILSLILLGAGILGARLYFVLFYDPWYYWQHPLDIFKIYEGGLSIHGGILGAIGAGLWYVRQTAVPFWRAADLMSLAVILAQGIARVGCDVYGKVMGAAWPWGVQVQGQLVHPVQIYEVVLDFALFIFLWGKRQRQRYAGQIFIYYLGGYALIRLFLEFFRINPTLIGSITPAHLSSFVFILAAVGMGSWLSSNRALHLPARHIDRFWVSSRVWAAMALLLSASIGIFYSWN